MIIKKKKTKLSKKTRQKKREVKSKEGYDDDTGNVDIFSSCNYYSIYTIFNSIRIDLILV